MNNTPQFTVIRSSALNVASGTLLACLLFAAATPTSVLAQGQIASGTISSAGSGPYTYSLSFSNSLDATSPVGSIWYAWVPGFFYLPGVPTSASAPAGWTATVSSDSVQFVASTAANDITAGQSLSGFSYLANFTPTQLAAAPNSGRSVAYSGALLSPGGFTFTVQNASVPEPSTSVLLLCGAAGLMAFARRKRLAS